MGGVLPTPETCRTVQASALAWTRARRPAARRLPDAGLRPSPCMADLLPQDDPDLRACGRWRPEAVPPGGGHAPARRRRGGGRWISSPSLASSFARRPTHGCGGDQRGHPTPAQWTLRLIPRTEPWAGPRFSPLTTGAVVPRRGGRRAAPEVPWPHWQQGKTGHHNRPHQGGHAVGRRSEQYDAVHPTPTSWLALDRQRTCLRHRNRRTVAPSGYVSGQGRDRTGDLPLFGQMPIVLLRTLTSTKHL